MEQLLSNRSGKGRHALPLTIPFVRLSVLHPVPHGNKRKLNSMNVSVRVVVVMNQPLVIVIFPLWLVENNQQYVQVRLDGGC